MSRHTLFQERLKKEYELKGYKVTVEEAFNYDDKLWVIDLVARKGDESIAIEIGSTYLIKLEQMKKSFTKVIHIPLFSKTSDGFITHAECNYTWKPRVANPKECPNCKKRVDLYID